MAQKKVGIKVIAEMSGVAPSTVSHALNGTASISDEVRERVLKVARDTGYLSRRRTQANIGALRRILLAIPPDAMPENDVNIVSWTILNGLTAAARRASIKVTVHEIRPDASFAQVGEAALAADMDGIIILNDDRPNLLRAVRRSGLPAVLINGEDPEMQTDSIIPANRFGASQATRHLIELGHRRILHLTWKGRRTVMRRGEGFADAFEEGRLDTSDALVLHAKGYEPRHGEAAIQAWLAANPDQDGVTALFCAADNLALGAVRALKAAGLRLPQDMSVMGFDGIGLGELHVPSLSTMRIPLEEFGNTALDLLERRVANPGLARAARRVHLGCSLIARDSTVGCI